MAWRNGYIPEGDLIIFNRGWNSTDGHWYWGLTPATYTRHPVSYTHLTLPTTPYV